MVVEIKIDYGKCTSCKECVKACSYGGLCRLCSMPTSFRTLVNVNSSPLAGMNCEPLLACLDVPQNQLPSNPASKLLLIKLIDFLNSFELLSSVS